MATASSSLALGAISTSSLLAAPVGRVLVPPSIISNGSSSTASRYLFSEIICPLRNAFRARLAHGRLTSGLSTDSRFFISPAMNGYAWECSKECTGANELTAILLELSRPQCPFPHRDSQPIRSSDAVPCSAGTSSCRTEPRSRGILPGFQMYRKVARNARISI